MLRKKKQPGPSYTNGNGYHSNGTKSHKTKFDFASRKGTKKLDSIHIQRAQSFSTSLNVDLSQDINRISSMSKQVQ